MRHRRKNPKYKPITDFFLLAHQGESSKVTSLALDIGNCILKVSSKPRKIYLRNLRKFLQTTRWFKKIRIIGEQLYLFRNSFRVAIILPLFQIGMLAQMARRHKMAKS